jgi:glycosyltransferase involved in cell wall biosynthesis
MSEAYVSRYNRTFIPFHNPITIEDWLPYSKKDWSIDGIFKLIYTGRIGTANNKSILFISKTIDRLNQTGLRIKLDIYSSNYNSLLADKFHVYKGVEVKQAVPHNSIPSLLSNYDLLLLPLDFDKVGIDFARYSMPTKASEYMISGTPTLVFADLQTALAKHAIKYRWAYVVSENSTEQLEVALNKLATDRDLRSELGCRAKEFAIEHFDSKIVQEEFKNSLQNAHLSCNF